MPGYRLHVPTIRGSATAALQFSPGVASGSRTHCGEQGKIRCSAKTERSRASWRDSALARVAIRMRRCAKAQSRASCGALFDIVNPCRFRCAGQTRLPVLGLFVFSGDARFGCEFAANSLLVRCSAGRAQIGKARWNAAFRATLRRNSLQISLLAANSPTRHGRQIICPPAGC